VRVEIIIERLDGKGTSEHNGDIDRMFKLLSDWNRNDGGGLSNYHTSSECVVTVQNVDPS
jgi:hypothetical protein